jgi:uncharacterized coiled-coil protein SlyX
VDVPLGLLVAAAGLGWGIVGQVVRMVFKGQLLTPREAKAMERRLDKLEETAGVKDETISEFVAAIQGVKEVVATNNALLASLTAVAREQGKTP